MGNPLEKYMYYSFKVFTCLPLFISEQCIGKFSFSNYLANSSFIHEKNVLSMILESHVILSLKSYFQLPCFSLHLISSNNTLYLYIAL